MSWVRIDDGFPRHPKLLLLTRAERYTWIELLCYCAEQRTDGFVPKSIAKVLRDASTTFLLKTHDAGLLDVDEHGRWVVHDWALYNGDLAARVAAYCEKYPQMSANDIQKATGGTRDVVLQLVRSYRRAGSERTTAPVDKRFGPNHQNGDPPGSESGSSPSTNKGPSVGRTGPALRGGADRPTDEGISTISDEVARARRELGLEP